jgi:DNA repair protein RadD
VRVKPDLRPYQLNDIARIKAEVADGKRRILYVAPTGSGKTVAFAAYVGEQPGAVLVVAHRRELTEQTSNKLYNEGVAHGIIQAGYPSRPAERVQIASIQTLNARVRWTRKIEPPPAKLIIIDEAHHATAATYQWLIEAYPEAIVVGITATACRADNRGLGNIFEVLIEGPSVAQLTDGGHLVPAKIYAPVRPDLTGVHVKRGDYVESELADRVNTAKLVGDIVEHWHKLGEGRRTVAFAVNVAHSVHIRNEFRRSGVLAEHLDGSTPLEERKRILTDFAAGTIDVVCNCAVLCEGWDRPEASCLILARPTKSLGLYRQMVGRVLRPSKETGKTDAIILDHSGAVFVHGFPDDQIQSTLQQDRRAKNVTHRARGRHHTPALTTCPECNAVRLEGTPCGVCGWKPVVKPKPIVFAEGELGAVERSRQVRAAEYTTDQRFSFYRQLIWIGRERGHKPSAAAYRFKERFGYFPPWDWNRAEPLPPNPATRAWVRSRAIAYARSQAANQ